MSRAPLLDATRAPLPAQPYYEDGDPGPIVAALANVPELLEVTAPFVGTVLGASAIDLRTKEIVILRASAQLSCRYCIDAHTVVARDAGLTVEEVAALRGEAGVEATFDERDQVLVAWTDAVAVGPGAPSDDLAETFAGHFDDAEVVELTLLVGATVMLNRFATSLQLPTSEEALRRLAAEGWSR